jgi:thiol:disulfide interchange protein
MRYGFLVTVLCFGALVVNGPVLSGQVNPFVPFSLAGDGRETPRFSAEALPEFLTVQPGQRFHVALVGHIAPGWVYYGPIPAGPAKGAAMEVKISTPASTGGGQAGVVLDRILWPPTHTKATDIGTGTVEMNVYTRRVVVYAALQVSPSATPGQAVTITLLPRGQLCEKSCVDLQPAYGKAITAELTLRIAGLAEPNPAWAGSVASGLSLARTVEQMRAGGGDAGPGGGVASSAPGLGFWTAIGVAILAGLSLNIMPCVLPVIPIRILSVVQLAGESRRRFVTVGLAFVGGMMLFFLGMAVLNIALKLTIGRGFDLNEGFQTPAVIITLAMIVVALAANLFGVFDVVVPGSVLAMGQGSSRRGPHVKSVGMGLMLAVLATPCSFAFLAAALTYAQTAPLMAGTGVILAIGLGMSVPHALLAAFPSLVDKLPKPGRWMEIFKQSTGFVLLLVAVWLIGALRGDGPSYPFWVLAWAVILVMCLWMWAKWLRYDAPVRKKIIVRSLALVLAAGSGWWMLTPPGEALLQGEKFDWAKIQQVRQAGRVVLVKFTATWCAKCLQQEMTVFSDPEVARTIEELNVYYVKADVSQAKTPGAKWMHENGYGVKIPMTLVFPPTGEHLPPMYSDLTSQQLIEKLREAAG